MAEKRKISLSLAKAAEGKKAKNDKTSKGPQTMEELLAEFEQGKPSLAPRDKVKGKVIKIEPGRVIIDFGGKCEGLVAEKAYKEAESYIKTLKVGDEVEGVVLVTETPDGYTILSLRQAQQASAWIKVENAYEKTEPIDVMVKGVNPSGLTVDVLGLDGFIPMSQLGRDASKNLQRLINKKIAAVVIDLDRENKRIILSEKEVSEKEELEKARGALKNIKEGDVFGGEVTSIYDFGCFVRIEAPSPRVKEKVPLEGLVHISELSWEKVERPEDVVLVGDKVKVKVIGKRNDKLAFSIKQTLKDPWEHVQEKYKKETRLKGKVTKLTDFGAFVQLEPGVEGLVHMTKIPPGKKLARGDEIDVYVEEVDEKAKKISLGLMLTEKPVGYK